jgi:hypothetical protein
MSINYYNTNNLNVDTPNGKQYGGVSAWQGIRYLGSDIYLICGTTNPSPNTGYGFIYIGPINCFLGKQYYLNVPRKMAVSTSVYGPNYDIDSGMYTFVGSYKTCLGKINGFAYTGKLDNDYLNDSNNFLYPSVNNQYKITFLHSNSNGFIVGNSGSKTSTISYIYNINDMSNYVKLIEFPDSITTTTYGIWYDGDNQYTIVGGYTDKHIPIERIYNDDIIMPIGKAFIVNYDSSKNIFYNWTSFAYTNDNVSLDTHFEGIYKNENNTYSVNADVLNINEGLLPQGYFLIISKNSKGEFITNYDNWIKLKYSDVGTTSSNSVANNKVVGIYIGENKISYQLDIPLNLITNNIEDLLFDNKTLIFKGLINGAISEFIEPIKNVSKLYDFNSNPIFNPYVIIPSYVIITKYTNEIVGNKNKYVNIQVVYNVDGKYNLLEVGTGIINDDEITFLKTETATLYGFIKFNPKLNKYFMSRFSSLPSTSFIDGCELNIITEKEFTEETNIAV